jgi:4-diphosphocytidyl-2-C-methyl-D-erythritol kinase
MSITLNTHAKLNLSLRVYAPRPDGYHPLQSIFQTISLHDTLTIEHTTEKSCTITCNDPDIPTDERNILSKTYNALKDTLPIGVSLNLTKRIPNGAGMGGGSTNAAGLLLHLNNEYLKLPLANLIQIATTIGADVPFFLIGGTAYVEGIGEFITPIEPKETHSHFLLVKPPIHCSTKDIFTKYDATQPQEAPIAQNKALLNQHLNVNDLKDTVFSLDTKFQETENTMIELNKNNVYMSGSGSTLFAPTTPQHYEHILPELTRRLPECFIELCSPVTGSAITIAK